MSAPLILVEKDGKKLRVHPSTVAAHVKAGWRVVEAEAESAAEAAEGGNKGKKNRQEQAEASA